MLHMYETLSRERMRDAERNAARHRLANKLQANRQRWYTRLMATRHKHVDARDNYTLAG